LVQAVVSALLLLPPCLAVAPMVDVSEERSQAEVAPGQDDKASCRICFEGSNEEAGSLVEPCRCSGTQAFVHEACLLRWRRLQSLQGRVAAARRCEVCGEKYAGMLAAPKAPVHVVVYDFIVVLAETLLGLVVCATMCPSALCSPPMIIIVGIYCLLCGLWVGMVSSIVIVPLLVLLLYMNGIKLSVLGSPGHYHLGLTSFGAPVDGLKRGMLLVSIGGAGGPFSRSVLFVAEHSDASTLAVILNKPLKPKQTVTSNRDGPTISIRMGGPLRQDMFTLHNIEAAAGGAERLFRGKSIFLSRNMESSVGALKVAQQDGAAVVFFRGFASWGQHQLEGEVRRGAWGWIRPEHVQLEDVFEMDHAQLESLWTRLINSPHLQIFQG